MAAKLKSTDEMCAIMDDAIELIAELRLKVARWEAVARNASSALNEAAEYFADRADADCGQDGFIPNDEMRLQLEMEEAMGALDALLPKATLREAA